MRNMDTVYNDKAEVSEVETLAKTDDLSYMEFYFRMKLGYFMSDRDGVVALNRYPLDDGRVLFCQRSIDSPKKPQIDKVLRMEISQFSLITQDGTSLRLTEFMNMDMKGYVPAGLLNMVLGAMVAEEYKNLRDMLDKFK